MNMLLVAFMSSIFILRKLYQLGKIGSLSAD